MKSVLWLLGAVVLIAIYAWMSQSNRPASSLGSLEYQGQKINLKKPYGTYEEYKDDVDNLAPGEAPKVQQLVKSATIAKRFGSREEVVHAIFDIKFPGYGMGSHGETKQPDGSVIAIFDVEIPQSDDSRYLVFRGSASGYVLVDDFIDANPALDAATIQPDGKIAYSDRTGKAVLIREPIVP